jgi:hypothetical protein
VEPLNKTFDKASLSFQGSHSKIIMSWIIEFRLSLLKTLKLIKVLGDFILSKVF